MIVPRIRCTLCLKPIIKAGNNPDVIITAKSGYKIGKTDKQFDKSISFTNEIENGSGVFYIKKTLDGTIYKGTIS